MHELSLSYSIVENVLEALAGCEVESISEVRLAIGELSGVTVEALEFSFPIAAAGTPVETARLVIRRVPVSVYCSACEATGQLESIQYFRCPTCGTPTGDIRAGKELDIEAIEYEQAHAHANSGTPA
jgi:hydrogenase nickel incorporation protein HypA/HybF